MIPKDPGFVADVMAGDGNEDAKNLLVKLGLADEAFQGVGTYAITWIFQGRTKTVTRWMNSGEEIDRLLSKWIGMGYGIKRVVFRGA